MDENKTIVQKKIAFAQSEHVEAAIALFRDGCGIQQLVGDNEFQTVVNAVTLDAQSSIVTKFINAIDSIKQGGLYNAQ